MSSDKRLLASMVALLVALSACSTAGAALEPTMKLAVGINSLGCEPTTERGVGVLLENGVVLTSAHVIAGATTIEVMLEGTAHTAQVLAFDPFQDLATLLIETDQPGTSLGAIELFNPAWIVTYDHIENSSREVPVEVTQRLTATITDIYQQEQVVRQVLKFDGNVEPGDSGAPLVDAEGRVGGIVFATTSPAQTAGFALDIEALAKIVSESHAPLNSWGVCD